MKLQVCHAELEWSGGEESKSPQPPFTKGGPGKSPSGKGLGKSPFGKGGLRGISLLRMTGMGIWLGVLSGPECMEIRCNVY